MAKMPSVKWTREHFLIALNLYCKLPFGKLHKGNPVIVEVAKKMERTPNSLAMKLCNFASLDPVQRARGIKGLPGATPQDRRMWDAFREQLSIYGPESEQLVHDLFTRDNNREVDFLNCEKVKLEAPLSTLASVEGPTEVMKMRSERRGQQFFRQTVLSVYGVTCCISGINVPRLLVASHIKPWSKCPDGERLDPRNGLCLSNLHDAAFDDGMITLDHELKVVLSKRLRRYFPQPTLEHNFLPFEGQPIRLPQKVAEPATAFLDFHREVVFKD